MSGTRRSARLAGVPPEYRDLSRVQKTRKTKTKRTATNLQALAEAAKELQSQGQPVPRAESQPPLPPRLVPQNWPWIYDPGWSPGETAQYVDHFKSYLVNENTTINQLSEIACAAVPAAARPIIRLLYTIVYNCQFRPELLSVAQRPQWPMQSWEELSQTTGAVNEWQRHIMDRWLKMHKTGMTLAPSPSGPNWQIIEYAFGKDAIQILNDFPILTLTAEDLRNATNAAGREFRLEITSNLPAREFPSIPWVTWIELIKGNTWPHREMVFRGRARRLGQMREYRAWLAEVNKEVERYDEWSDWLAVTKPEVVAALMSKEDWAKRIRNDYALDWDKPWIGGHRNLYE